MSSDNPSSEFIYDQVKASLLAGETPRDSRVDVQRLADRYRVSVTPIREALFRLMGERLIRPFDFGGFAAHVPAAAELHQLYGWNGAHLLAAAHLLPDPVMRHVIDPFDSSVENEPVDPAAFVARLSLAIGAATGNAEFVAQIRGANDRLHRARRAEAKLFHDLGRELRSIVKSNASDVRLNVRRRLTAYHRRRIEAAPQISALIL